MAHSNGKLISELKVQELRLELARRELETSGIKGVLVARLEEVSFLLFIKNIYKANKYL